MSDFLPSIGGMAFRRYGFVQSAVVSRWNEIVGDKYAHVTAPEMIKFPQGKRERGTLTITVVPAHAPMMQHVTPMIVERVNRFFGYQAIERVLLRQGEVIKRAVKPHREEAKPLSADMDETLKPIADPELRAVLEALARGVAAQSPAPSLSIPIAGKIS